MEIKFRAKTVNTNEWVESLTIAKGTIKRKRDDWFFELDENRWVGVIAKTIGQFISINDKNGKEICEGDILYYAERNQWYKVFKVGGGFAVNTHQDDFKKEKVYFYTGLSDMQNGSWVSGLEIKGNIHDNPELLNMTTPDYDVTKEE
jgi:hypothetical protein